MNIDQGWKLNWKFPSRGNIWLKPIGKHLSVKTFIITCYPNSLVGFYMIQAFTERYILIDFTTNMEFGIFSYAFFWRTSAKDVKCFYWLLLKFLISFVWTEQRILQILWIPLKYQNTQTMVLSIVFVVFFTVPMYFLGNILFITQLKLSLDIVYFCKSKEWCFRIFFICIWTLPGFVLKSLIFHYFQILKGYFR